MLLTHIAFYVLFYYLNNTIHFKFFKLKFHAININDFIYKFLWAIMNLLVKHYVAHLISRYTF